jgi:hypothetical protein
MIVRIFGNLLNDVLKINLLQLKLMKLIFLRFKQLFFSKQEKNYEKLDKNSRIAKNKIRFLFVKM